MDAVGGKHFVDRSRTETQVVVPGQREVIEEGDTGLFRNGLGVKSMDRRAVVSEGVCGSLRRDYDMSSGGFECHSGVLHVPKTT